MYAQTIESLLYYKISVEPDGVKLRIWENASDDSSSSKTSFLYIINCRVNSIEDAKDRLMSHLALNGSMLSTADEIPKRGKIKLLPFPTLDQCDLGVSDHARIES